MSTPDAPPQDLDAEAAVLGAIMYSARALADVTSLLTSDDFYAPKHAEVFAAALAADEAGEAVDPLTVKAQLEHRGTLARIGGAPYLHTLQAAVVTTANADFYARRVADKAMLRRLVEAGQRIILMGNSGADAEDVAEIVEQARATMDSAASGARRGIDVADLTELVDAALASFDHPAPPALNMGWRDLDAIVGGLRPGTMTVLAARPGAGKTIVGMHTALNVAAAGTGVLYASLEMPTSELTERALANIARVDHTHIQRRQLTDDDRRRLHQAREKLDGWPMKICDIPNLGVTGLRTVARDYTRASGGLGLIVVDYLQLMRASDPSAKRYEQVGAMSRGLKLLAKELDVPVVAISALNRGAEGRADKRPVVAELRESGSIEADADAVLLLHHDAEDSLRGKSELEVIVGKNRHGRAGESVNLAWSPQFMRADDLSRRLEAV